MLTSAKLHIDKHNVYYIHNTTKRSQIKCILAYYVKALVNTQS